MYDFSLLPDDSLLALFIALVLFSVAFVSFSIVAVFTLVKSTVYSKRHKDKLHLICDVAYFHEKGNVSTFVGRFIPGIRQLISIPAGLSRMHFGAFLWWTFLGAFIWNCILAILGYVAAGQMDLIKEYSHELSVAILILLGVVILYYLIRWIIKKRVKA